MRPTYKCTTSTVRETLDFDQQDYGLPCIFADPSLPILPTVTIGKPHTKAEEFREQLLVAHSAPEINKLFPYQVSAALNIAYRPAQITVTGLVLDEDRGKDDKRNDQEHTLYRPERVTSVYCRDTDSTVAAHESSDDDDSESEHDDDQKPSPYGVPPATDLGRIVVNDLCSGSGKTLITMLGCLLFAMEREEEIRAAVPNLIREQLLVSWFDGIDSGCKAVYDKYNSCVLVLCPPPLVPHWAHAARLACNILKITCPILESVASDSIPKSGLFVAIYSDTAAVPRSRINTVAAMAVDEFTSTTKSNRLTGSHNISFKDMADPIVAGRIVLISSEAGKVTRSMQHTRTTSMLRRWSRCSGPKWNSITAAHGMLSCSILPTSERLQAQEALDYGDVALTEHTVRYDPSLAGLLFGEQFEASGQSVRRKLEDQDIMQLPKNPTLKELQDQLAARLLINFKPAAFPNVLKYQEILTKFGKQTLHCSTCNRNVPATGSAHLMDCLHINCTDCFVQTQESAKPCVLCTCPPTAVDHMEVSSQTLSTATSEGEDDNSVLEELASAAMEQSSVDDDEDEDEEGEITATPNEQSSLSETLEQKLAGKSSMREVTLATLLALHQQYKCTAADKCFRAVVVMPNGNAFKELSLAFSQRVEDVPFMGFAVLTTKRKRSAKTEDTEQQHLFLQQDSSFKVFFAKDVASPALCSADALIYIGSDKSVEEIRRLTRLGRTFPHGLHFISIVPR